MYRDLAAQLGSSTSRPSSHRSRGEGSNSYQEVDAHQNFAYGNQNSYSQYGAHDNLTQHDTFSSPGSYNVYDDYSSQTLPQAGSQFGDPLPQQFQFSSFNDLHIGGDGAWDGTGHAHGNYDTGSGGFDSTNYDQQHYQDTTTYPSYTSDYDQEIHHDYHGGSSSVYPSATHEASPLSSHSTRSRQNSKHIAATSSSSVDIHSDSQKEIALPAATSSQDSSEHVLGDVIGEEMMAEWDATYSGAPFSNFPELVQEMVVNFLVYRLGLQAASAKQRATKGMNWWTARKLLSGDDPYVESGIMEFRDAPTQEWMKHVPKKLRSAIAAKVAATMGLSRPINGYSWLAKRVISAEDGEKLIDASCEDILDMARYWPIESRK
ncbi:hypothetical protein CBS101457_000288 [Exobasidium rhododendri]|nr:hypothetical protein CBS101457_000288 [Exobasidium rhododendri]